MLTYFKGLKPLKKNTSVVLFYFYCTVAPCLWTCNRDENGGWSWAVMGGQKIMPPTDVSNADHSRARNATVKAYVRPNIKKPEDDATIAASRDRIKKVHEAL